MAKKKQAAVKPLPSLKMEPLLEEPSTVSTSSSPLTPQLPKHSPYTSCPVALHIGPEQRVYYVPRYFLQNPEWIASASSVSLSSPWTGNIHLPDVDENTGHVLVHYLYTGAYQTLDNINASLIEGVNNEFKGAVLVYMAAKTYKLHDLQQLAKQKIEHFGAEMHIFDIIDAIKENFSNMPGDAVWFHDYLVGKAKTAFEEDHTVFARDDFFDRIKDGALGRFLVKCVVGLFNDKVSRMLNTEGVPVPRISEECIPDAQDSLIEEFPAEDCFSTEDYPAEACPAEASPVEACPAEDCPVEASLVEACSAESSPVEAYPTEDYPAAAYPAEECPVEDFHVEEASIEEAVPVEPAPELEKAKEEENPYPFSFGDAKVKKKMKKNEGATLIQEIPAEPEPESEQAVEAEGSICPVRARHLLEGDMWKDCRLCRAVLRQVAIQIARADHTYEDGYEIVDQVLIG